MLPWYHGTQALKEASHQVKSPTLLRRLCYKEAQASRVEKLKCTAGPQLFQPSQVKHQTWECTSSSAESSNDSNLGCHLPATAWRPQMRNIQLNLNR